jgi:hypothetical protein
VTAVLSTKPDVSIATKVASKLQIEAVHCAQVSCKVLNLAMESNETLGWHLDNIDVIWHGEDGTMRVLVPYKLKITATNESSENKVSRPVAQISLFLRLDYRVAKDQTLSDDERNHFAGVLGVMHSWPYLRADVQALTAKVELPPLTLPVIVSGNVENMATVRKISENDMAKAKATDDDDAADDQEVKALPSP